MHENVCVSWTSGRVVMSEAKRFGFESIVVQCLSLYSFAHKKWTCTKIEDKCVITWVRINVGMRYIIQLRKEQDSFLVASLFAYQNENKV